MAILRGLRRSDEFTRGRLLSLKNALSAAAGLTRWPLTSGSATRGNCVQPLTPDRGF
jgi:hypothetical protein